MPVNTTRHDTIKTSAHFLSSTATSYPHSKTPTRKLIGYLRGFIKYRTHISKLDTKLHPSIPKWSLTYIQAANLPGYYEHRTNTTIHITNSHNFSNVHSTMRVFLVYLVQQTSIGHPQIGGKFTATPGELNNLFYGCRD
jgi:hypothetical protein